MEQDTLNKKLAEWAGLDWTITYEFEDEHGYCHPFFTDSLDACFKWLVPRLIKDYQLSHINFEYSIGGDGLDGDMVARLMWVEIGRHFIEGITYCPKDNEASALAFCLAIGKLIDGEK